MKRVLFPKFWIKWLLILYTSGVILSLILTTLYPDYGFRPEFSRTILERNVHSDGVAAVVSGTGPALLLLHGSPGSADNFSRMIPTLQKKYRVIVPDLPGFGASSIPHDFSLEQMSDSMFRLMDHLGVDQFQVLGYSYGSGIALNMASRNPERIKGLILYGGIGVQEGEGSGSYTFEHIKYLAGFPPLVVLPEVLPHFGLLGPRKDRFSFIMSFIELDQRPLRGLMEKLQVPVLILQGIHDPLVPVSTAIEHRKILPNSRLILNPRSHFLPFSESGATILVNHILEFSKALEIGNWKTQIKDVYLTVPNPSLPVELDLDHLGGPLEAFLIIAFATFFSEDLTIISTGLLVGAGRLDFFFGTLACFFGIFIGDMGLWIIGFFIRVLPFLRKFVPESRFEGLEAWYLKNGGKTIFLSRFIPGTRFITYTGAGFARLPILKMTFWAFLAGGIWAPVLVFLAAYFGNRFVEIFTGLAGNAWVALILALPVILIFIRFLVSISSHEGRRDLKIRMTKISRFEYWPPFLAYIPVGIYILYLSIRYRSLTLFSITNPSIPHSGIVGESKSSILSDLNSEYALPWVLLDPKSPSSLQKLKAFLSENPWGFPVILKPDASQRGAGLRLGKTEDEVIQYFEESPVPFLIQKYHPGPYEAGVFVYRLPGTSRFKIFSITRKVFPAVTGDGNLTLRELIQSHPRYRLQENVFLKRFEDNLDQIPENGETRPLTIAGNHCQGTMFKDGSEWISPSLEKRLDEILDGYEGFFIGRFDLRFSDPESFKNGNEFGIVELNGVTSESTNIYDPDMGILEAYRIQFRHLEILWKIGNGNRKRGHRPMGIFTLIRLLFQFYWKRRVHLLSD